MIDYTRVIEQIRSYCPSFGTVTGSVTTEVNVVANPELPAAYVVPLDMRAGENEMGGPNLRQYVEEAFAVIVVIDTGKLRGFETVTAVPAITRELFSAILNWNPDQDFGVSGIEFVSKEIPVHDAGRAYVAFTFSKTAQLDNKDGWDTAAPPLEAVGVELETQGTGLDTIGVDAVVSAEATGLNTP